MRPLLLSFALVVSASAASAGGIVFSLPNLHFPPKDAEVSKDCLDLTAQTSADCEVRQ